MKRAPATALCLFHYVNERGVDQHVTCDDLRQLEVAWSTGSEVSRLSMLNLPDMRQDVLFCFL